MARPKKNKGGGQEPPKTPKRPKMPSVSGWTAKDLFKFAKRHGFKKLDGRGKGSHIIMRKPGSQNIIIPNPNQGSKWCGRDVARVTIKTILGFEVVS